MHPVNTMKHWYIHQSKKMIQALTGCMEQMLNRIVKDFAQYIFDLRKCTNKNAVKKTRKKKASTSCLLCYHGPLSEKLVCLSDITISNDILGEKDQYTIFKWVIFPVKSMGFYLCKTHKPIISYTHLCISCVSWLLKWEKCRLKWTALSFFQNWWDWPQVVDLSLYCMFWKVELLYLNCAQHRLFVFLNINLQIHSLMLFPHKAQVSPNVKVQKSYSDKRCCQN